MTMPDILKPAMNPSRPEINRQANLITARVKERYAPLYPEHMLHVGLDALQNYLTEFAPTPRSSGKEGPMGEKIMLWAETRGFHAEKDAVGNVAYVVPGDPNLPVVGLHFHQDIVAVAKPESPTHPETDGVFPEVIEGRERDVNSQAKEVFNDELWLQSVNGLTSGGFDNGLGGSVALAISEHMNTVEKPHGAIVVLATVGEEVDFRGAKNIEFSPDGEILPLLEKADFIINDDMEADNDKPQAIEGAYGVEEFRITSPFAHEPLPDTMQCISLSVDNLLGGHSGLYPERTHAAAVLVDQVTQILGKSGEKYAYQLASFEAGEKHNQIGERGTITLAVSKDDTDTLLQQLAQQQKIYTNESPVLKASLVEDRSDVLTNDATTQAMTFLHDLAALQGPVNFQPVDDAHLFCSYTRAFNLGGIGLTPKDGLQADVGARIGQENQYGEYEKLLRDMSEGFPEMKVNFMHKIDMWPVNEASILPRVVQEEYKKLPIEKTFPNLSVETVPAGLELGTMHTRFPRSQNITLGMWIERIHKAGERANVRSFLENAMLALRVTERLSSGQDSDEVRESMTRRAA
ncbi:MAG TPA: hypothetical protein VEW42_05015 [Candidatus Eisenbacteria bacterium]|nr:hypothetical protein [Candidatus Eisenbacteria bacterium]